MQLLPNEFICDTIIVIFMWLVKDYDIVMTMCVLYVAVAQRDFLSETEDEVDLGKLQTSSAQNKSNIDFDFFD